MFWELNVSLSPSFCPLSLGESGNCKHFKSTYKYHKRTKLIWINNGCKTPNRNKLEIGIVVFNRVQSILNSEYLYFHVSSILSLDSVLYSKLIVVTIKLSFFSSQCLASLLVPTSGQPSCLCTFSSFLIALYCHHHHVCCV